MSGETTSAARSRRRAILFVLASSGSFTITAALVKLAAPEVPVAEMMLFRSGVAFVSMLPLLARYGGWGLLRTRRPWGHLGRALSGLAGMGTSFYGYARLPLAAVTALGFAMPIFLALLSIPLLGERVSSSRRAAIAAALLGVLMVIRPWEGAAGLPLIPTGIVLAGVVAWALSMVSIRRMGQQGERNITIVLVFTLTCTVLSAFLTIPVWVTPRPFMLLVLVLVGVVSGGAQLLMTEGYRNGEASMLAPFEYSAIFYTVLMGWLFWDETPGAWEAAGMVVLVASGLFTWWRETREG